METRKPSKGGWTQTAACSSASFINYTNLGPCVPLPGAEVIDPLESGHDPVCRSALVCLETIWGLVQDALAKGTQELDKSPTWPLLFSFFGFPELSTPLSGRYIASSFQAFKSITDWKADPS